MSPWTNPFALARRCRGTNRQGQPCNNPPMLGGFVCKNHGGASPQATRSRTARLRAMVDPVLDRLLRIVEAPNGLCATCGRSDDMSAVVRACVAVLDRAGYGPKATLAIETASRYEGLPPADLALRALELAEQALDTLPEEQAAEARQHLAAARALITASPIDVSSRLLPEAKE